MSAREAAESYFRRLIRNEEADLDWRINAAQLLIYVKSDRTEVEQFLESLIDNPNVEDDQRFHVARLLLSSRD